jgi:hypothetical protein
MRPRIVGAALQEISRDRDISRAMFSILETQKLLEGEADLTLTPQGNELLPELIAAEGAPKQSPAPPVRK